MFFHVFFLEGVKLSFFFKFFCFLELFTLGFAFRCEFSGKVVFHVANNMQRTILIETLSAYWVPIEIEVLARLQHLLWVGV